MGLFEFDRQYIAHSGYFIAGVDEAGRGPWAGPVVAAAVVFPTECPRIQGLNDSKKLSSAKREKLFDEISKIALSIGVGKAGQTEIDEINILRATQKAMTEALSRLTTEPSEVLVDGNQLIPNIKKKQKAIVSGDSLSASIAAASIIAKVTRDQIMCDLAREYPQYGFERHKGYGTKEHLEALQKYGPSPVHRLSFAPVKNLLIKQP
jgi:ribonuclease HII